MAWVAVAVAGSTLIGGMMSSDAQQSAASTAAGAQTQASEAGIAEQRRQFDQIQALLKPYVDAGGGGLIGQKDLIGLNGPGAQTGAIDALANGPQMKALTQVGENSILQNASATGGLRGGNTQAALAQFRPQMLAQLINDQYSKLGGLTSTGLGAATNTGNAGMNSSNQITQLLQQAGAANAGSALAAGKADAQMWGNTAGAVGQFAALGGFGKF